MKKLYLKSGSLAILATNILSAVAVFCVITCMVPSCARSGKLDVKGIQELVQKNSDDITSADIDFFLDQVEILANMTKGMSDEERNAYFESLDKEEQECAVAVGMMASLASSSKTKSNPNWSDAQLERLKALQEKLK